MESHSKSAPSAFQYDEAGKPFARLVEAVGCPLSSVSVSCLQEVPFEVCNNCICYLGLSMIPFLRPSSTLVIL